jgi:hypothetical protein
MQITVQIPDDIGRRLAEAGSDPSVPSGDCSIAAIAAGRFRENCMSTSSPAMVICSTQARQEFPLLPPVGDLTRPASSDGRIR